MKFKSAIKTIEKNIAAAFPVKKEWRVLMQVFDADGNITHTNGEKNPTTADGLPDTINIHGVKPNMIINHRPITTLKAN